MAANPDDASSGEDIPFRSAAKAPANDVKNDGEDDEDMEEDEYIVESIKGHKFSKKGELIFRVKWEGWDEKDNTWEPEENLENCPDQLEAYFNEVGGKPVFSAKKIANATDAKKRKLSQSASLETPTPPPKVAKKPGRQNVGNNISTLEKPSAKADFEEYPKGSWENDVLNIDTLTRDEEGNVFIWVVWKSGKRSKHASSVAYQKCPQKCLQFYEAHLHFNYADKSAAKEASPEAENARQEESVARSQADDEDDMIGVKGVAKSKAQHGDDMVGVKRVATAV